MRIEKVILLLFLGLVFSCTSNHKTKETNAEKSNENLNVSKRKSEAKEKQAQKSTSDNSHENDCDTYWQRRFPQDSVKAKIIDDIIRDNSENLSANNIEFLSSFLKENEGLAFNRVLNPIFKLSKSDIGLIFYPKFNRSQDSILPLSDEIWLIEKHDTVTIAPYLSFNQLRYFPDILDSIYSEKEMPIIYYYTSNRIDSTQITALGKYFGECLEYYEYSLDSTNINSQDSLLIASPLKIDLEYSSDTLVDSLLKYSYNRTCYDCPSSEGQQKTFAQFEGVDNLFFLYADTFPINDELHTPSRALVYFNEDNELIYLWYSEVDLFGCSCL